MNKSIFSKIRSIFSQDVIHSAVNQMWRIISGPLTLLLIPLFLTPELQGFWYTFGSISALSIFADLGFTMIVSQFAAHEFAFLRFDDNFRVIGPEKYIENLSSLFRFILKWMLIVIIVVFPIVFFIGYILFVQKGDVDIWLVPWLFYTIGAGLAFFNGVIASFIQGCGQVANIQKIGFRVAVSTTLVIITGLILNIGLYALAISIIIANVIYFFFLFSKYHSAFVELLKTKKTKNTYGRDLLSLLWKYAISWSSGYFIVQIYTPFMFHFHGAVEAGKVGITMNLIISIFSISNTWFTANTPKMNMYVSKKKWSSLDIEYRKNLLLSIATFVVGIIVLFSIILILQAQWDSFSTLSSRFLGIIPLSILIICWFVQIIVNGMAVYLRAHKQEPYVVVSAVSGIFVLVTTYLSAKYMPSNYIFLGFALSFVFILPWSYYIYKNKKQEWHSE